MSCPPHLWRGMIDDWGRRLVRKYVFVDEAGNFDFSPKGSNYFILTSVTLDGFVAGDELLGLRRSLAWNGIELTNSFHAAEETQAVRNQVFDVLSRHDFQVDSTIFEKRKTQPHLQSEDALYPFAWFFHMKHVAPCVANHDDELMVVGASFATKKKRKVFADAVARVMRETAKCAEVRTACWAAGTDRCLQIADYCSWAIQRKWEQNDLRSHVLITSKIRSEYPIFQLGKTRYY
jgi:hypothetical protein